MGKENKKEKEWNSYNFEQALTKFILDEPFYSYLSCRIEKVKTEKVPTAGVNVVDGKMFLYYNEEYFKSLSWKHRHGLLMHEFMHLALSHTTSRKVTKEDGKADTKWYWAADYAINSLINEEFLPPHGLVPGKWSEIDPTHKSMFTEEEWNNYMEFVSMVKSWPKYKAADWYYNQMKKNKNIEKGFDVAQKLTQGGKEEYSLLDDHDLWEELSQEEKEIIEQQMRDLVGEAIENCTLKDNNWGSLSKEAIMALEKEISNQLSWEEMLKLFAGNSIVPHKNSTIKKINKRYPYIHPGKKKTYVARIALCIDESASVNDRAISMFISEAQKLGEHTDFTIVPFDTKVNEEKIYEIRRGETISIKRDFSGGTDFNAPTEWINKNHSKFDATLFMTDGECSKPQACLIPRAWIIMPNRKICFDTDELVIQMS